MPQRIRTDASELECKFFSAYGIEPEYQDCCEIEDQFYDQPQELTFDEFMKSKCKTYNLGDCSTLCPSAYTHEEWPEITDSLLFRLLCIYNKEMFDTAFGNEPVAPTEINEELKELVLDSLLPYAHRKDIREAVREVIKYGGN